MWGERRGRWLSSHWQMAPQRRNAFSSCRRQPSWANSNIPTSSLSMGFFWTAPQLDNVIEREYSKLFVSFQMMIVLEMMHIGDLREYLHSLKPS